MKVKLHRGGVLGNSLSALRKTAVLALAGGVLFAGTAAPALACGDESYTGTVCSFSFDWCPSGWLPANGQQVQINGNQALYSLLGTRFGGDGKVTFGLPDLRGRSAIGYGAGPGLPQVSFAAPVGNPTTMLTVANLPPHNHGATFTGTGGGQQTVSIPADAGTLGVSASLVAKDTAGVMNIDAGSYLGRGQATGGGQAAIYVPSTTSASEVALGGLDVQLTGTPGHGPISFSYQSGITGGAVAIGNTGNGAAFSNQSPSLALNYCIQAQGIYPPRP